MGIDRVPAPCGGMRLPESGVVTCSSHATLFYPPMSPALPNGAFRVAKRFVPDGQTVRSGVQNGSFCALKQPVLCARLHSFAAFVLCCVQIALPLQAASCSHHKPTGLIFNQVIK